MPVAGRRSPDRILDGWVLGGIRLDAVEARLRAHGRRVLAVERLDVHGRALDVRDEPAPKVDRSAAHEVAVLKLARREGSSERIGARLLGPLVSSKCSCISASFLASVTVFLRHFWQV